MASVTVPTPHFYLLVVLVVLLCPPSLKCFSSHGNSDNKFVMKGAERSQSSVSFGGSPNEDAKVVEFDDAGLQERRSLDNGSRPLRKTKRDIEDIIAGRPVNFPPVVVKRTTDALRQILALLGGIDKALNTATTTLAPPTSPQPSTSPASNTTAPQPSSTPPSTSTPATTPVGPVVNATSPPASTSPAGTSPAAAGNNSATTKAPAKSSEGPSTAPTSDPKKGPPPTRGEAMTQSENILGDQVLSQVKDSVVSSSNETTVPPPNAYSPRDVIIVFQALSKNAEDVMADELNMSTVIALEKSVETLNLVNKTAAFIDRGDGMSELQIWLRLVQMSCSHALKKLEYGKSVMALFGNSDDITILITAAFCTLALICCIVACLMGRRPLKPSRGNYAIDGTAGRARPMPSTRRNTSSASSEPPERPFSVYSSPARAAVSSRSNPNYSSHRSVDVDPSASYRPAENNLNYDESRPDADDNTSDPTVTAKNERNANLGKDRLASTRPSTTSSDYKDPRRHRSSNLARGRNNEGYSGDDVIGVRSDSESVL